MTISIHGIRYDGHHPFYTERRMTDIISAVCEREYRNNGTVIKPAGKFPWKNRDYIFAAEGYQHLPAYIYRKFTQGFEYFARKLGYQVKRVQTSRKSLKDPERLLLAYSRLTEHAMYKRDTDKMIKPPGVEPAVWQLRSGSVYAVAVYNAMRDLGDGSLNRARKKLGLKERTAKGGKWKDWEAFSGRMKEIKGNALYHAKTGTKIKDEGIAPSGPQLAASGNSGIYHAAFRYHGSYDKAKKRLGWTIVKDMPSFMEFLETNEGARELVGLFYTKENLEDLALARALAAAFPDNFTGKADFIDSERLLHYKRGQPTLREVSKVADIASKNELLSDIVLNMARDATFGILGENPTEEQIDKIYGMTCEREREESDPRFRWLLTQVREEFDAFLGVKARYNSSIRAAKEQDQTFQPHELTFGQLYGAFSSYWRGRRMLHADVAGYGKTAQAIAAKIMQEIRDGKMPTIVFGPNSAKQVWEDEANKNYPAPEMLIVNSYDDKTLAAINGQDFAVLNYDALSSSHTREKVAQTLSGIKKFEVVLDESQLLKGSKTTRYRMIKPMLDRAAGVHLVSFTPFDSLPDAYVAISILEPDKYPTPENARKAFVADPLVLHAVISRHMTRRGVEELPDVEKIPVKLSQQELEAYLHLLAFDYKDTGQMKLDQLRKAAINPALVDSKYLNSESLWKMLQTTIPAKYLAIDRILEGMEPDAKAIIFSSYLRRGVMKELEKRYAHLGALRIDSTIPYGYRNKDNRREEVRRWFLENKSNRVLVTNETAGESLSLAYYDGKTHFIFLDIPPSLIRYIQAITREWRRGNKYVVFYNLVAVYPEHPLGSIDEGLTELIRKKLEANRILLDGGRLSEDGKRLLSGLPLYKHRPVAERLWTPEQVEKRKARKVA